MRKFTLATLALIGLSFASNAQIKKGSFFLGGSVGFGSNSSETTFTQPNFPVQQNDSKSFSLYPQIGIAVGDNRIAGFFLNLSNYKDVQESGVNYNANETKGFGGGLFYRRYYPLSSRFYLFGDASLGYFHAKYENTTTSGSGSGSTRYVSQRRNTNGIGLGLTPGISYAAGRKVFLEASLNDLLSFDRSWYETKRFNSSGTQTSMDKGSNTSGTANANGFSALSVGLRWILPRKK